MANSFQQDQERPELEKLSELAENLVYRLPGCDRLMIRKTIQEVYREFCRETKCLSSTFNYPMEDRVREYPLYPMYGGIVGEIRSVRIDGRLLTKDSQYTIINGNCPIVVVRHPWVKPPCRPFYDHELLSRRPLMTVKAVEYPMLNAEESPVWFIERHGESICSGVLSRLMSQTGKAWSDAAQAGAELVRYENAKSEARMMFEMPADGNCIDMKNVL